MLIAEAGRLSGLTKKAIEYYIEQKLISPDFLENGYRDFTQDDIERLKKISVLRRLGLNTESIKLSLADDSGAFLQKLSVQKELQVQRDRKKQALLEKLSAGSDYSDISDALKAIEQTSAITEKLLEAFPGYFGKYICLHFAGFLDGPVSSPEQREAYQAIISFLDNLPALHFSAQVQDYLDEYTGQITASQINSLTSKYQASVENPEKFLSENKEVLDFYYQYMRSDEYKSSVAYQLRTALKEFNNSTGYYDIFIPAMKKLSPSYAKFCELADIAGQKIARLYPETLD